MKSISALAAIAVLALAPTAHAGDAAVEAPIQKMMDGFNKGDIKAVKALHVASPVIVDEFGAPYVWTGPKAFDNWVSGLARSEAKEGKTGGVVNFGTPIRESVVGDHAYVGLSRIEDGAVKTAFGDIEVRRLNTNLGKRVEPVTYWLTVGDQVIKNGFDKRLAEIRLGLTGQIPDGLLFRVSSIDPDSARAFALQQKFIADMMAAVPGEARRQLSGLTAASKGG